MVISPIFVILAKALIISFILIFLKITGKKTALIYFAGVLALFFLKQDIRIAEMVLRNTVFLYFAYLFLYSLSKKTIFYKKEEQIRYPGKGKKQLKSYLLFFLTMFFYNSVLLLVFKNQGVSFVLSVVFFFIIEVVMAKLGKNKISKILGKNRLFFYLIADIGFVVLNYPIGSLDNSVILLFIFFSFNIITDAFAIWCPLKDLKKGMIPAEFILKDKGVLKKENIPMFLNSLLRQKAMNNYFGKKEIISPFKPLTRRDIGKLKASNIETLKIQKTINLSVFVILGIIAGIVF